MELEAVLLHKDPRPDLALPAAVVPPHNVFPMLHAGAHHLLHLLLQEGFVEMAYVVGVKLAPAAPLIVEVAQALVVLAGRFPIPIHHPTPLSRLRSMDKAPLWAGIMFSCIGMGQPKIFVLVLLPILFPPLTIIVYQQALQEGTP